jgi:hypothetical protein
VLLSEFVKTAQRRPPDDPAQGKNVERGDFFDMKGLNTNPESAHAEASPPKSLFYEWSQNCLDMNDSSAKGATDTSLGQRSRKYGYVLSARAEGPP